MDESAERLALIEVEGRDGRAARVFDVRAWPLTIGRSLSNQLVLDDPHVAPEHARLDDDGHGGVLLTVLDPVNGVVAGRRRLRPGPAATLPADSGPLQFGATRLHLRLPGETLAPTRPLPGLADRRGLPLWATAVALLVVQSARQWIGLDPGADYSAWLPVLANLPLAVMAWCGLWALLSKLFQHRFDFAGHLQIALPWLLAMSLLEALWPQVAASLAAPWLWQLGWPILEAMLALLVRAHLIHILPAHPRAVTIAVLAFALSGAGILLALNQRASDSLKSAPYMSTLPLPALRLGGVAPSTTLVQQMAPLAQSLERRAKQSRDEEADEGADPDS